jgi:hypothetical protein
MIECSDNSLRYVAQGTYHGETVLPLRSDVKLATDYRCQKFREISRFFSGTISEREPGVIPSVEFRMTLIVLLILEWKVKFQRE